MNFDVKQKVHIVGINGSGLSTLAAAFRSRNIEVTGSDMQFGGHNAKNVPHDINCLVYTIAAKEDNPEILRAKELGIPTYSYPEMLGILSEQMFTIAVAGTHGKTTTTNMIGKILTDAGLEPLVIAGAPLQGGGYMFGKGNYLVVEACEYKRSFLNIHPDIAVVTNIDVDHLDYFKTKENIEKAFDEFIANVKTGGKTIREFDSDEYKNKLNLKIPGAHNVHNAMLALAASIEVGVKPEVAVQSLNNFGGAERRFEYKGKNKNGALIFDDYAHHPTEISATISGVKSKYPNKKLAVIFQPHLFSRTREHFPEFIKALSMADEVILLPVYAAREVDDGSVSMEEIVKSIKQKGTNATYLNMEEAREYLQNISDDYVVMTMGAGDVNKISDGFKR